VSVEDETVTTSAEPTFTDGAAANSVNGEVATGNLGSTAGGLDTVGSRVREERLRQRIGVRELARRVGVSASLISQVELGKASPSVGTLYAIVNELGLSLDELFFREASGRSDRGTGAPADSDREPVPQKPDHQATARSTPASDHAQQWDADAPAGGVEPVVRRGGGKVIQLATGVRWERLAPPTPQDVDFLQVAYQPGSESCPPDSLMRHSGHEYGHIISGRMGVTVGFETYELGPGDSVAFDSTMPHRLFAIGDETVEAIWVVVGRRGDGRLGH
jgi:transcriptional regulator with XRE-family HTH domain/quercetin dioxygenase-like cupin family protein